MTDNCACLTQEPHRSSNLNHLDEYEPIMQMFPKFLVKYSSHTLGSSTSKNTVSQRFFFCTIKQGRTFTLKK